MARDGVVERGAEMRSLAIVAGETRVRLGDVGGRALRWRPPILLRHWQNLKQPLSAVAAAESQLEDLGLAAVGGQLEIALGAVDFPEQVRAARIPAAIVDRARRPTLEQPGHGYLMLRCHGLVLARARNREGLLPDGHRSRALS